MIWVASLALLALLPLGVWLRYDEGGILVRLAVGPVKVKIFPRPQKPKKEKAPASVPAESGKASQEPLPKPPQPPKQPKADRGTKGGSLEDFFPLVKVALDLLNDIRRKLRLDDLYLRLILGGSDPCDLAVNYGRTWAAVGNLMPQLERLFVIKKRDIEVGCDFTATQTLVIAQLEITITLGRLLALAAVYGYRGLKEFIIFKRKRKGGAVT